MMIAKLFLLLLLLACDVCCKNEELEFDNMTLDGGIVHMQYQHANGTKEAVSCPRYFFTLSTANVQAEIKYKLEHDRWSDRVILDLLYYGLQLGDVDGRGAGLNATSVQKKRQIKWDILQRKSTLPDELHQLSLLERFEANGNRIHGKLNAAYGSMSNLRVFFMGENDLEGTIPESWLNSMTKMEYFSLAGNSFTGTMPQLENWELLVSIDLSRNHFEGSLHGLFENKSKLLAIYLSHNKLTGPLPTVPATLEELRAFEISHNQLTGTISTDFLTKLPNLEELLLESNRLTGNLPKNLFVLSHLRMLRLGDNMLTGPLPTGDAESTEGKWADMKALEQLDLKHNNLSGTIPSNLFVGLGNRLTSLDLGFNALEGRLPSTLKYASKLLHLFLPYNNLEGEIPLELAQTNKQLKFNFTQNRFTDIPKEVCDRLDMNIQAYFYFYGCNPLMCEKGTFTLNGRQDKYSGCQNCPGMSKPESEYIGRATCPTRNFTYGDQDMTSELSEAEILRLLHVNTGDIHWGRKWGDWGMPMNSPCKHPGVTCSNGHVTKIDLSEISLCTDFKRNPLPDDECRGLPSELAQLGYLEVLKLGKQPHLRGTIPWELGHMNLEYLEITNAPGMIGTIPSSFGHMTNLKVLNLSSCKFNGTIPEELYELTQLEKLHLNMNMFTGQISSNVKKLTNLKELMMSRTYLSGTIPEELGELTAVENLELYGAHLSGNIPESIGNCTNLKRIDLFNNKLTGPLPDSLSKLQSLQILHLKLNQLTGTISPNFGQLSHLSWFDVSSNKLMGTIPSTFGASPSLHDFRVGNNRIYAPIPPSLCKNAHINGGVATTYGCDGIVCPLGTFSETGHATDANPGCVPCPDGLTTMYLGASKCELISDHDILNMFYDVLLDGLEAREREQFGSAMDGGRYKEVMIGTTSTEEARDDTSRNTGSHWSWKDPSANVCEWKGVKCDSKGEILSFRFPTPFLNN